MDRPPERVLPAPGDLGRLIDRALPLEFPFYHLGLMRLEPDDASTGALIVGARESDQHILAYRLRGDLNALIILLVDRGLDPSTYAEAGNVLASRVATELSQERDLDVMISPPLRLDPAQLQVIAGNPLLDRTYLHLHKGIAAPVRLLVASMAGIPGVAHA